MLRARWIALGVVVLALGAAVLIRSRGSEPAMAAPVALAPVDAHPPTRASEAEADSDERASVEPAMTEPLEVAAPSRPSAESRQSLTIEIVGTDGSAMQGVSAVLAIRERAEWWQQSACTDSDTRGMVRFDDVPRDRAVSVELPFVTATPDRYVVRPGDEPSTPLRFVVEPTAAIDVSLRGFDGQPFEEPATVQLLPRFADRSPDTTPASEFFQVAVPATAGRASFEHVAIDSEMRIGARGEGVYFSLETVVTPRRTGERAQIELFASGTGAVASLRLLDEKGAPLAREAFSLACFSGFSHQPVTVLAAGVTDERGEARLTIQALDLERKPPSEVRVILPDLRTARIEAFEEEVDSLERKRQRLGDLVVRPPERTFSGRVVDSAGAPIAGALVTPSVRDLERRASISFWPNRVFAAADGSFTFALDPVYERVGLYARAPGFGFAPLFDLEAKVPVVVRLQSVAMLRGRIVMPDGVFGSAASVILRRSLAGKPIQREIDLASDGSFEVLQLDLGLVDVVAVVFGVEVPIRSGLSPARGDLIDVGEIDLSAYVRALRVEVVDERGDPLDALVSTLAQDQASPIEARTSRDGSAVFGTGVPELALRVSADGRRAVEIVATPPLARVVLPRGIPLEVRMPSDLPPIDEPYELVLWVGEESPETHGVISCFGGPEVTQHLFLRRSGSARAGEVWTVHLPRPGSYCTAWSIVDRRTHAEVWRAHGYSEPFAVGPEGCGRVVELRGDIAACLDALQAAVARGSRVRQR